MDIALQVVLLIAGFVLLIKGADWLISGASSVAANFKVSKLLIGLTIVAFGTGAPELAVSVSSILSKNTDLLLGNVVGSNILNILLLIGIASVIRPVVVKRDTVAKELPLLLLISTILIVLFLDTPLVNADFNMISRSDGIICLLAFGIFLYYIIAMARKNRADAKKVEKPQYKLLKSFILVVIGLTGVVLGSQLVVNSASAIATAIGISDRIIALTIVAFGTSLPELVTTVTAAKRGENELLVGNIIGSNIFNICIVLGLPVAIFGSITPGSFEIIDIVMLISSALLLWLVVCRDRKISRMEGVLMLTIFAVYYSYLISSAIF
ncbi:MAG: calcium/sodium antiporter [Candidatus Saccharibacteria bacterium]|nr:calcium/sodium antiporter [Candidatus Saccharibacteria bacterium]